MDLIDRDTLIEEMKKLRFPCMLPSGIDYLEGVQEAVKKYSRIVNEAPTVDVMPLRYGWWEKNTDLEWDTEYHCSLCKHKTHMHVMPDQRDNWIDDYCGGCGAKMDGGMEK